MCDVILGPTLGTRAVQLTNLLGLKRLKLQVVGAQAPGPKCEPCVACSRRLKEAHLKKFMGGRVGNRAGWGVVVNAHDSIHRKFIGKSYKTYVCSWRSYFVGICWLDIN